MILTFCHETAYLLNNADVLNQIILDRSTNHSVANEWCHRRDVIKNADHAFVRPQAGNSSAPNKELIEQMQNFQAVINLLTELRR